METDSEIMIKTNWEHNDKQNKMENSTDPRQRHPLRKARQQTFLKDGKARTKCVHGLNFWTSQTEDAIRFLDESTYILSFIFDYS